MNKIVFTLVFCASTLAQANFAKDLSNVFCSAKYRERAEAALFPVDGRPSFFTSSKRDPERWYSTDKYLLASVCRGAKFDFPELTFLGVSRTWLCGHLVYKCLMTDQQDGRDEALPTRPSLPDTNPDGDNESPLDPDTSTPDEEPSDEDSVEDPTDDDQQNDDPAGEDDVGEDETGNPTVGPAF